MATAMVVAVAMAAATAMVVAVAMANTNNNGELLSAEALNTQRPHMERPEYAEALHTHRPSHGKA